MIRCLEPGPRLAGLARRNLQQWPDVDVVETTFEGADEEPGAYDAVFSATAFHWVDPQVGYSGAGDGGRSHRRRVEPGRPHVRDPPPVEALFEAPVVATFPWTATYDRAAYVTVLATQSSYALPAPVPAGGGHAVSRRPWRQARPVANGRAVTKPAACSP